MQVQRRLDYKFYSLGWRSGLYGNIPKIQHLLLSIFCFIVEGLQRVLNQLQNTVLITDAPESSMEVSN
jgi:hypothetical protein